MKYETLVLGHVIMALASNQFAIAGVEGFSESFSGQGEYASLQGTTFGLDAPGWSISDGSGQITSNGYEFSLETHFLEDSEVAHIDKKVLGNGSYETVVDLLDLSFGAKLGPGDTYTSGIVRLNHYFLNENSIRSTVTTSLSGADNVRLGMWIPSEDGRDFHGVDVPFGDEMKLGLAYNRETSSIAATLNVVTDGAEQSFELSGLMPIDLAPESVIGLEIWSIGINQVSGILNSWALLPSSSLHGDFNGNEMLDVADLEMLIGAVRIREQEDVEQFDISNDLALTNEDIVVWVKDLRQTYFGDANLDGEFASSDLVNVFAAGEYEDEVAMNSTWTTGDWDANGDFTTSDLVLAFQDGGYEHGPRVSSSVPEPTCPLGLLLSLALLVVLTRGRNVSSNERAM